MTLEPSKSVVAEHKARPWLSCMADRAHQVRPLVLQGLSPTRFVILEPLQRRAGQTRLTVAQHVQELGAIAPEPAVLVGWSWGAMLGLSFSAALPERVAGLALVGCGTYDEGSRLLFRAAVDRALGASGRRRIAELQTQLASETDPRARDRILSDLGDTYMGAESYDLLDGEDVGSLPPDELWHSKTWNDVLRLQREGVEPAAFRRITLPS